MLPILRKQKGFTLIEVIVGLVILGILTVIITPTIQVYFQQNRLKGAAENLHNDITMARTTAIKQASAVTLSFITGASWCYGVSSIPGCVCTSPASCNLGAVSSADYPSTTLATTLSGGSTTFTATRGIPNNSGTITLTTTSGGSQSVQLSLSGLGTSILCSPSGTVGGYTPC